MGDLVKALLGAPVNSVLVVVGLAFLALAVLGKIGDRLDPGPRGRIGAGVLGAILLVLGLLLRPGSSDAVTSGARPPAMSAGGTTAPAPSSDTAVAPPAGHPAIALPAGQVIKRDDRTYTILKMQLAQDDATDPSLEITVRMLNEQGYPANFWDDSFRLVVDGMPRAPVSDLNELVETGAAKDGVVKFAVPKTAKTVALQIERFGPDAPSLPIALAGK
ncbi:MAG TPA: hypothetical protein VG889_14925 [Rhizomicrobium sp.]|nr:hypothetical protein [Rhizomicrobium sp.]